MFDDFDTMIQCDERFPADWEDELSPEEVAEIYATGFYYDEPSWNAFDC